MTENDDPILDGDSAMETKEVDASVLRKARERFGKEIGEVSDDEIDRILRSDEVEEVDHTREIDTRTIREKHGEP